MVDIKIRSFVRQVGVKATIFALVLGLLTLLTGKLALFLGLIAGALVDISTFYFLGEFADRLFEKTARASFVLAMVSLFGLRLFLQVLILYLALVFSSILNFWTTLIGVLIIQITIFIQAMLIQFQLDLPRGKATKAK